MLVLCPDSDKVVVRVFVIGGLSTYQSGEFKKLMGMSLISVEPGIHFFAPALQNIAEIEVRRC